MKKRDLFLCIAASTLMLTGCVAYDRAENFFTKPVVKDVKKRHEPSGGESDCRTCVDAGHDASCQGNL
ncbi:hypothetical protein OS42_32420 [Dickeya oryzae]